MRLMYYANLAVLIANVVLMAAFAIILNSNNQHNFNSYAALLTRMSELKVEMFERSEFNRQECQAAHRRISEVENLLSGYKSAIGRAK